MWAWGGINLWLPQRAIALGFVSNYDINLVATAIRLKGRADSLYTHIYLIFIGNRDGFAILSLILVFS